MKIASVAAVETKERQYLEKVHVLLDDDLLPGRALDAFKCARVELETPDKLEELIAHAGVFFHAKRQSVVAPRSMHVHGDPRVAEAGYIVKMDGRTVLADLGEGACCGGHVGFRENLLVDAKHLPFLLEDGQEFAKVLVGATHHCLAFSDVSGRAQRGDLSLPAGQY